MLKPAMAGWQLATAAFKRGDYAAAANALRPLARGGDAEAQYNLGVAYKNGLGVPRDDAEAERWFRAAALQGHSDAQYNLGVMYFNGLGVPRDHAEAVKWYYRAAEQGNAAAQSNLGAMYGNGDGVPRNYIRAYKWASLAETKSRPGPERDRAAKNREIAAAHLTEDQIVKAEQLVKHWLPWTPGAMREARPGPETSLSNSEKVTKIQTVLATLGFDPGPIDGVLGPRTRSAIRAFQSRKGLHRAEEPIGAIAAALPSKSELEAAVEVARLQRILRMIGYDPGPIDGILGSKTRAALKRFQEGEAFGEHGRASDDGALSQHPRQPAPAVAVR